MYRRSDGQNRLSAFMRDLHFPKGAEDIEIIEDDDVATIRCDVDGKTHELSANVSDSRDEPPKVVALWNDYVNAKWPELCNV